MLLTYCTLDSDLWLVIRFFMSSAEMYSQTMSSKSWEKLLTS